jgi:hypothetical protein
MVDQPLFTQPVAHAGGNEQIDARLLEHASANAMLDVIPRAFLENDGLDAVAMQQMAQQQPRGPGTDDTDLCVLAHHACQEMAISAGGIARLVSAEMAVYADSTALVEP